MIFQPLGHALPSCCRHTAFVSFPRPRAFFTMYSTRADRTCTSYRLDQHCYSIRSDYSSTRETKQSTCKRAAHFVHCWDVYHQSRREHGTGTSITGQEYANEIRADETVLHICMLRCWCTLLYFVFRTCHARATHIFILRAERRQSRWASVSTVVAHCTVVHWIAMTGDLIYNITTTTTAVLAHNTLPLIDGGGRSCAGLRE